MRKLSELNHLSNSRKKKSTEILWSSGERKQTSLKYFKYGKKNQNNIK